MSHPRSGGNGGIAAWKGQVVEDTAASLLRIIGWSLAALATINVVLYSRAAATPLVQADAWYFLENFLVRYFNGSLSLLDLFMQRGDGDHAQPLQKLILLFHTRYFDMDFGIEGLIGTAIGVLWCCAVAREMRRGAPADPLRSGVSWACIGLVFALGLSLNSTNIYTWPLATLGFIPLLLGTLYFSLLMTQLEQHRPAIVLLLTALLGLCIDEIAMVVVLASFLACIPLLGVDRRRKIMVLAAGVVGLILARVFLAWVSHQSGNEVSMPEAKAPLLDMLFTTEALRGLLIPFSDSLLHPEHFDRLFPGAQSKAFMACAVSVTALHIYFWCVVFVSWLRLEYGRTLAMATFLMLLAYGLTAGIIISRVPIFDWNYLHQPRYVMSYQISLVAIAVLFQHRLCLALSAGSRAWRWTERLCIVGVIVGVLIVQCVVSKANWGLPRYLSPYWQNAALSMQTLASDPQREPGNCPDIMSVCHYGADQREQLMGLLVEKQLNIFSPAFQMRYRLYPSLANIPGFGPGEAQIQQFDRRIQQAPVPAALTASASPCTMDHGARHAKVAFNTHDLAPFGAQLWIESLGAPRAMIANVAAGSSSMELEHEIPDASVLTLVRADGQSVLAQLQVELPQCPSSPP